MTTYTAEEVARHNTSNDLWMIIHGGVYDLTKFLQEHPGGEEVLLNLAGQDGTVCFDEIGHSDEGVQLRDTYRIGQFIGGTVKSDGSTRIQSNNTIKSPTVDDDDWVYEEHKPEQSNNTLQLFIGALVIVYAIIFYFFM